MEHLWAPWRNLYVLDRSQPGERAELFKRIGQSNEDEKNLVVARGKSCFALLNAYPYNTGHLMVVPYQCVANLEDLSDEETLELWGMVKRLKKALASTFSPEGFNIGINLGAAAGAGIQGHLHVHVVPRWSHDANFMTTTAGTRIHPNDLATVYLKLKKQLEAT